MKHITKTTRLATLLFVGIFTAIPFTVKSQVYSLSTPISGNLTMGVEGLTTGSGGSFYFNVTNLTETIYLDPVGQTIRQVGVFSGMPTATNISFQETQQIAGQFPNPPTNVSGSVTVTLAPVGGNLTFDTGANGFSWDSSLGGYSFGLLDLQSFNNNFVGSYSLITGGQTYSGLFYYSLSPYYIANHFGYSVLYTS